MENGRALAHARGAELSAGHPDQGAREVDTRVPPPYSNGVIPEMATPLFVPEVLALVDGRHFDNCFQHPYFMRTASTRNCANHIERVK